MIKLTMYIYYNVYVLCMSCAGSAHCFIYWVSQWSKVAKCSTKLVTCKACISRIVQWHTIYVKTSAIENFHGFHSFSLDRKSFSCKLWPCQLVVYVYRTATAKVLLRITIFHSKHESFPKQVFCCTWYLQKVLKNNDCFEIISCTYFQLARCLFLNTTAYCTSWTAIAGLIIS